MNLIELKKYDDLDYSLIYRDGVTLTPFVCAWNPSYDDNGFVISWSQGHYFNDIESAVEYMNELKNKKYKYDVYEYYMNLTQTQKDNLRLFSCFNVVDDCLNSDFDNRDNYVKDIGSLAYHVWLTSNDNRLSCEDIAIAIANAFLDDDTLLDKLNDNYDPNLIVDCCLNNNFDKFNNSHNYQI